MVLRDYDTIPYGMQLTVLANAARDGNGQIDAKAIQQALTDDNRPMFLRCEIAKYLDVARAGEKMYYLSAGFLIFRQSSSCRD